MQKQFHWRTVLMVLLIYAAVLFNTIFRAFPIPTASAVLDGTWAKQTEEFLMQNLGFHDSLFRLKTQAELLLGEKRIRNVYITDDMLLEKLPSDHSGNVTESAQVLNEFYEKYQIPTYFVLVPSASEIYESSLPANAVKEDQKTLIQQTYANVRTGIRCVDACNVLSSLKDEYIYYRTDTRWTTFGAYSVYQSAIRKMGLTAVPYNRFVISHMSTEFRGNLYERTLYDGIKPDVLDRYTYEGGAEIVQVTAAYADGSTEERETSLYEASYLQSEEMYRFYLGKPCAMLTIRTNLENDRRLLLYKDEFADCMIPFLLQHYSEVCVVDLTQSAGISDRLAAPTDFTQVLFLCSMENWSELWKMHTT